jgi:hypothetical protein
VGLQGRGDANNPSGRLCKAKSGKKPQFASFWVGDLTRFARSSFIYSNLVLVF